MASGSRASSGVSTASPEGAEASSVPRNLEEVYAPLLDLPRSPALAACLPGICPWCVLRCRHGDVRHALQNVSGRRSHLPMNSGRGRFILQHCLQWIIERAQEAAAGTLVDPDMDAQTMEAWGDVSRTLGLGALAQPPAGAAEGSTSAWLGPESWLGWSEPTAARRQPPPQIPPMRYAGASSSASWAAPPPPSSEPPPPPPPPPGLPTSSGIWEVWGGRSTKWVRYPDHVCQQLTHMAAHGTAGAWFFVEGKRRWINVRECTQTTEDSDNPPRKIRIRPTETDD